MQFIIFFRYNGIAGLIRSIAIPIYGLPKHGLELILAAVIVDSP